MFHVKKIQWKPIQYNFRRVLDFGTDFTGQGWDFEFLSLRLGSEW